MDDARISQLKVVPLTFYTKRTFYIGMLYLFVDPKIGHTVFLSKILGTGFIQRFLAHLIRYFRLFSAYILLLLRL